METHNEDRATYACEVCGQFCQTKGEKIIKSFALKD